MNHLKTAYIVQQGDI